MSDSTAPGPSATRRRGGGRLRFWLLMTIGLIWVFVPPAGAPGTDRHGPPSIDCPCPECKLAAKRQLTGLYKCDNHHNSRLLTDGSRKCDEVQADNAPRTGSEQAGKALTADSEQADKALTADSERADKALTADSEQAG